MLAMAYILMVIPDARKTIFVLGGRVAQRESTTVTS
jgi:hypothetical protein